MRRRWSLAGFPNQRRAFRPPTLVSDKDPWDDRVPRVELMQRTEPLTRFGFRRVKRDNRSIRPVSLSRLGLHASRETRPATGVT